VTALPQPASLVTAPIAPRLSKIACARPGDTGAAQTPSEETASDATRSLFPQLFEDLSQSGETIVPHTETSSTPESTRKRQPSRTRQSAPAARDRSNEKGEEASNGKFCNAPVAVATVLAQAAEKPWSLAAPQLSALPTALADRSPSTGESMPASKPPLTEGLLAQDALASDAPQCEPEAQTVSQLGLVADSRAPAPSPASQPAGAREADPPPAAASKNPREKGRSVQQPEQAAVPLSPSVPVSALAWTQLDDKSSVEPAGSAPDSSTTSVKPRDSAPGATLPPSERRAGQAPVAEPPVEPERAAGIEPPSTDSTTGSAAPVSSKPAGELAFAVRLQTLAEQSGPQSSPTPKPATASRVTMPKSAEYTAAPSASAPSVPGDDTSAPPAADPPSQVSPPERHGRNPESTVESSTAHEKPRVSASQPPRSPEPPSPATDRTVSVAPRPPAETGRTSAIPAGKSTDPTPARESSPAPDTDSSGTAARTPAVRDIRLELDGGNRRVEVRVAQRAADLNVSVRTPDARLAGDLREELPALTARLEQTGFRAEAWHPPAAVQGRPHAAEARATVSSGNSDSGGHSGGRDGQNDNQQPKPKSADGSRWKQDRERFARLLGALS
jgi:hypothetical protein